MALNILLVLCPNIAHIAKSLASHIISNSLFQSGVTKMEAITNLDFISSNAALQDSSKSNFASFSSSLCKTPTLLNVIIVVFELIRGPMIEARVD